MKRFAQYIVLCTFSLCIFSCRPLGDDLVSYGQNDYSAFVEANRSFAGEFKAFWHAMNENYGIWDYEEEKGVDWDEVYNTFLPKFEALDDTVQHKNKVTDAELRALYLQFVDSLHDGHLYLQIKNLHTGHYIELFPSKSRNERERGKVLEDETENITNLGFYRTLTKEDLYCALDYDRTSSDDIIAETIDSTCSRLIAGAKDYILRVDSTGGPDQFNDSIYMSMQRLIVDATKLHKSIPELMDSPDDIKKLVETYHLLCSGYNLAAAQMNIATPYIDAKLAGDGLKNIQFALFHGNVAYLRFGGFGLTPYLAGEEPGDTTSLLYAYQKAVVRVWSNWFDTIQTLHANGNLGGIVIDVRNNPGGMLLDYQFVLGALLPSGEYDSHYLRVKNGTGRFDFAPVVPFRLPTFLNQHAVITEEPIVILANSRSVSMAEVTTWGVKSRPNGYFIGSRTWGGLSALNDDFRVYSDTYSGCFGQYNQTPFYGYVPRYVSLFGEDEQILEGIGVTPDQEVPLDVNQWKTLKRDNQLEAALDYIQSH